MQNMCAVLPYMVFCLTSVVETSGHDNTTQQYYGDVRKLQLQAGLTSSPGNIASKDPEY